MRNILPPLVIVLLCLGTLRAAPARDAFDGRWTVTVTPADGGKSYEDTLVFHEGKFHSTKDKAKGFVPTEYETDTRGGTQISTFTATATSKAGTAKWTGTATAGQLQGSLSWTKDDKTTVEFTFTGKRAGK